MMPEYGHRTHYDKNTYIHVHIIYSFLASGNFRHLLITFANSLDPDQDRGTVGPDLDSNCLTL